MRAKRLGWLSAAGVGLFVGMVGADPEREVFCDFILKKDAISIAANRQFGNDASTSIPEGSNLHLEQNTEAIIAKSSPFLDSTGGVSIKAEKTRTLTAGTSLTILQRHVGQDGFALYRVSLPDGSTAYVESIAIMKWYMGRSEKGLTRKFEHLERRKAWVEPQIEKLVNEVFTSKGLDEKAIRGKAADNDWLSLCRKRNKQ
ncbi:MAG: hypothetical protein HQL56_18455 [Magnetococcales bacterium]|nr:hypothetical protein [Magnetococcales bacterium]